jgi:hypothetical protein
VGIFFSLYVFMSMSGFLLTTASVLRFNALGTAVLGIRHGTSRWIILTGNEPMPNAIPYQTRFDKVCLVGKSRFHHFNDGGSLIITTPHK